MSINPLKPVEGWERELYGHTRLTGCRDIILGLFTAH
jgi:hypothetical protein